MYICIYYIIIEYTIYYIIILGMLCITKKDFCKNVSSIKSSLPTRDKIGYIIISKIF